MPKPHWEWKVGLFLLVTLVLLAGLMVLFSKGLNLFQSAYTLRLKTTNVGLLISGAPVLMAGVQIGSIDRIDLEPHGRSVSLWVRIRSRHRIHRDARFVIDQIGLLGDQYVSVIPQQNAGPLLEDGDEAVCEEPFNIQSVARSSMGLIQRVDETVQKLKTVVVRVDEILLSPHTLTNLTGTISNLHQVSERAAAGIEGLDELVQTNTPGVTRAVSNLVAFSRQLNIVARNLQEIVATNQPDIRVAVTNLRSATESVNGLLGDLDAGRGLAGLLLKEEALKSDISTLVSNLTTLSSNLNRFGLLYKPKKKSERQPPLYPARKY